jgi:cephalosporin hydroxylase
VSEVPDRFEQEKQENISRLGASERLKSLSLEWLREVSRYRYSYHFTWLGRPIIQFPQDILAVQEILWRVRPERVVETGIARGGSLLLSASVLELLGGEGRVIGIDREIRSHNRQAIAAHPLCRRITMIEGSSTDEEVVRQVVAHVGGRRTVVLLDSHHTHAHVLRELELYAPLVGAGSYLVVFDTIIEDLPEDYFPDRPWGKGDNPKTAVREFLRRTDRFEIDREIDSKLLITVAPEGYLRCTRDP